MHTPYKLLCIFPVYISRKCVFGEGIGHMRVGIVFSDRKRAESHARFREKKMGLMARGRKDRGQGLQAQEYRARCVHVHAHDRVVGESRYPPRNSLFGPYFCGSYARTSRRECTRDPINRFLEDAPARFILRSLTHTSRRGRSRGLNSPS